MRNFTLCWLFLFASFSLTAQLSPFQAYQPLAKEATQFERLVQPTSAGYFQLDSPSAFAHALVKVPEQIAASDDNEVLLTLPGPDGELATFRVFRYQMITDELQQMYPDFVTLEGWDVDAPQRRVSLNWTSRGFRASVVGGTEGRWYVEPLYRGRTDLYQSFYTANMPYSLEGHGCDFEPNQEVLDELTQFSPEPKRVGNCQLQEYDLALACTANYFNQIAGITTNDTPTAANQADVIAEMMVAINRVNQVFKLDLAIQLNIINLPTMNDGVQLVFGGDTLADPYSDFSGLAMLNQNQTTTDNTIGAGNYGIGHVFSTGGGGVASLGSPCNNSVKARGVTGLPNPVGDPFYIDFVAHEIGHQFGGTHTFNSTEGNCAERSANTAYEPGGGTTIQAYAGICGPTANIQLNSDPYYHAASIQQISAYMELGGGSGCADVTSTANTEPTVMADGNTFSIPTNTPFVLDAVGMDGDGDALTYCWEQFDLGNVVAGMPTGFETGSPLFRSLPPTSTTERYFPNLPAVVAGGGSPWEVLPQVARDLTFIVTVRDNGVAGYGCTVQDQVDITVVNTGEQYKVTAPDGGEAWVSGGTETVTWDVAGTDDAAGINCSTVEILLSLDGGASFTTSLGTFPNNGTATVTAPVATETDARIMIRCDGNIFYDVSDADFNIEDTDFSLTGISTDGSSCSGGDPLTGYQIEVEALQGYVGTVNLTATGLPAGVMATITPATVTFTAGGGVSQLVDISLSGVSSLAENTYNFEISGEDGGTPKTIPMTIEVAGDFGINQPTDGQVIPDDGSGNSNVPLVFDPVPGASSYTVILPGGSSIALGNTTNTTLLFGMQPDGLMVTFFVRTNTGLESCPISVILGETVASGTSLSSSDTEASVCETRQTDDNYVVTFTDGDLTGPADLTVTTVIPGLTVNLTSTTLSDGQSTLITFDGEENLAPGDYTITIEADDGASTETIDLSLLIQEDGVSLTSPEHEGELIINPDGSGIIPVRFDAVAGATSYTAVVTFPSGGTGSVPNLMPPGINITLAGPLNDGDEFSVLVEANNGAISCDYDFTFLSALPVQWLSFTAEAVGKVAQLNWAVIQDESHAGFAIERSGNGQSEWQQIGHLERISENNEASYSYTDVSVSEGNTYYYRLRQEDVDGSQSYSLIRTVTFNRGGAEVFVFPNPTTGLVDIRTGEDAPEELTYRLFSPLGQIIRDGNLADNQARVNLQGLPAGVYQLVVASKHDYLRTVRVVKR